MFPGLLNTPKLVHSNVNVRNFPATCGEVSKLKQLYLHYQTTITVNLLIDQKGVNTTKKNPVYNQNKEYSWVGNRNRMRDHSHSWKPPMQANNDSKWSQELSLSVYPTLWWPQCQT
jgi:hypothetical protein